MLTTCTLFFVPQELGATFSTPPERLALNYMEGLLHFPARRQALEASYNLLNTPTKRVIHAFTVLLAVCPHQTWVRPAHTNRLNAMLIFITMPVYLPASRCLSLVVCLAGRVPLADGASGAVPAGPRGARA